MGSPTRRRSAPRPKARRPQPRPAPNPWTACLGSSHLQAFLCHAGEIARNAKTRSRDEARAGKGDRADAHRQGDCPCRALLPPRRRAVDQAGPGRRQWQGAYHPGSSGQSRRQSHGGWQASSASRSAATVALSQVEGARDQPQGPARAEDRVRSAAGRASPRGLGWPSRLQHRGAAAAHHRWRACEAARAAYHWVAQALSRAGAWQGDASRPRQVGQGHHHRRRAIRAGRGEDRSRAGRQCLVDARAARRQEPRGEAARRNAGAHRQPPDPNLLRAVRARRLAFWPSERGQAAGAQGSTGHEALRRIGTRYAVGVTRAAKVLRAIMRIVAGKFRSARIEAPKGLATRPTSDRVRQALFNVLEHGSPQVNFTGARVLDLFAGSGALGLEALSRGARFCLFVEESADARAAIRRNVEALSLTGVTKIWRRDATKLGEAGTMQPFDLIFLDPPYGRGLGLRTLQSAAAGGWIKDGAIAVLEDRADAEIELPAAFQQLDARIYGETKIVVMRVFPLLGLSLRDGPSPGDVLE